MSQYKTLDALILKAVCEGKLPLYNPDIYTEAKRIADATGRECFLIIDGRVQSLRKSGKIVFLTKAESNGHGGWKITKSQS